MVELLYYGEKLAIYGERVFVISERDAAVMLMGEDGWLHSSAAAASPPRDAQNVRLEGGNRDLATSSAYSPQ